MSKFFKAVALIAGITLLASTASAHPHKIDKADKPKPTWPYFGDSEASDNLDALSDTLEKRLGEAAEKMSKSMDNTKIRIEKRSSTDSPADDIRGAGEALENMLSESGAISSLADMMAEFAEDFEIEESKDGEKIFLFDGKEMAHFKLDSQKSNKIRIGGLGQNLSIDRDTIMKNGKMKTRIVIEMDGGKDIEIEMPEGSAEK